MTGKIGLELHFAGDATPTDVTALVRDGSVNFSEQLFNDDKRSVQDILSFSLKHDQSLLDKVRNAADRILVHATDLVTAESLFTGALDPSASQATAQVAESISFEAIDSTWRLDEKIAYSFSIPAIIGGIPFKVCDPADTANSIFHQVCYMAGYDIDKVVPEIAETALISHCAAKAGDETYREFLDTLLFEHRLVLDDDEAGNILVRRWARDSDTYTDTVESGELSTVVPFTWSRRYIREDGAQIEWAHLQEMSNALLYRDSLPVSADGIFTGKAIAAGDYYPPDSDIEEAYQSYVENWLDKPYLERQTRIKNRDISLVSTDTQVAAFLADPGITIDLQEYEPHRARVRFRNTGGTTANIYTFEISGKALFRSSVQRALAPTTSANPREYTSRFLFNSGAADALAVALAEDAVHGDFEYTFGLNRYIQPGTTVRLQSDKNSIDTLAIIQKCDYESCRPVYHYMAVGVAEWHSITEASASGSSGAALWPIIQGIDAKIGQLDNLDDTILDAVIGEGWTETPNIPVLSFIPQLNAILLKWDRQSNLSNLKEYHVQVSENETDWYPLQFDRTDYYQGAVANYTIWNSEQCIHTLPLADGEIVSYYYRVRRVTRDNVNSSWSTSVLASTTLIDNGSFSANTIYSNLVSTEAIQTAIAQVSTSITINEDGFVGSTSDVTKDIYTPIGTRKLYMDRDELRVEKFDYGSTVGLAHNNTDIGYSGSWINTKKGQQFIINNKLWILSNYGSYCSFYVFEKNKDGAFIYQNTVNLPFISGLWMESAIQGNTIFIASYESNVAVIKAFSFNEDDTITYTGNSYSYGVQANIYIYLFDTDKIAYHGTYSSSGFLGLLDYDESTGFSLVRHTTGLGSINYALVLSTTAIGLNNQGGYWQIYDVTTGDITTSTLQPDSLQPTEAIVVETNKFIEFRASNKVFFYSWSGTTLTRGDEITLSEGEPSYGSFFPSTASNVFKANSNELEIITYLEWSAYGNTYPDIKYRRWLYNLAGNTMTIQESKSYDLTAYNIRRHISLTYHVVTVVKDGSVFNIIGTDFEADPYNTIFLTIGYLPLWQQDLLVGGGSSQITADTLNIGSIIATGEIKPNSSSFSARGINISTSIASGGIDGDIWIQI